MIDEKTISKKEDQYKAYIDTHRVNVAQAWNEVKMKCMDVLLSHTSKTQLDMIEVNIKNHDISKYGPEEFDAYRKWFYSVDESEKDKEAFDKAWKHHYENNLYHPNNWNNTGNKDIMPYIFIVEMLCNWQAMGYVFKNTAKEYYESHKEEIQNKLGKMQIEWTEELLNTLCE